jgi:hypothetical protein
MLSSRNLQSNSPKQWRRPDRKLPTLKKQDNISGPRIASCELPGSIPELPRLPTQQMAVALTQQFHLRKKLAYPLPLVTTQIILLLFAMLAPQQLLHAQAIAEEKVPPLVFGAMLQRYPDARQVKWKRFRDWYQASYTQSKAYRLVRFSGTGDVEATGQVVALGALSLPIKYTLATYYPTRTICQAIEVTNARTGGFTYEMATCETAFSRTITLTANGRKVPRLRPE